jgi:hypothetical protein
LGRIIIVARPSAELHRQERGRFLAHEDARQPAAFTRRVHREHIPRNAALKQNFRHLLRRSDNAAATDRSPEILIMILAHSSHSDHACLGELAHFADPQRAPIATFKGRVERRAEHELTRPDRLLFRPLPSRSPASARFSSRPAAPRNRADARQNSGESSPYSFFVESMSRLRISPG